MILPTHCHLWLKELTLEDFNLKGNFLILEMFDDNDESLKRILRCNDCKQIYFYEFYNADDDAQKLSTLIPVATLTDAQHLAQLEREEFLKLVPRLHKDWPKDRKKSHIFWVRGSNDV